MASPRSNETHLGAFQIAKKRFEDDNTEIENTAIYKNLLDVRFTLL